MAESKSGNANNSAGGLGGVVLRNGFYRDGWRTMVTVLPILSLTLAASLACNIYLMTHEKEPRYFVPDGRGHIVPIAPLSEPYISQSALLTWVTEAATGAYTFDADNYRKQLQGMSRYFTPEGHVDYMATMKSQISFVTTNTLIASAVPTGAPVLLGEGLTPDRTYAWKIRVPVMVNYRNSKDTATKRLMLTIVVVRRQTYEDPTGIGISQMIAREE